MNNRLAIIENKAGGNWEVRCPMCASLITDAKYALVVTDEDGDLVGVVPYDSGYGCLRCGRSDIKGPYLCTEKSDIDILFSFLQRNADKIEVIPQRHNSMVWDQENIDVEVSNTAPRIAERVTAR